VDVPLLDRAFAALHDPLLRSVEAGGLGERRRQLLAGLRGHVVEIGAGTGANLPHYGTEVTRLTLTEPSRPMADRLQAHVQRRLAEGPIGGAGRDDVTVVVAPAEALPLPDASADAVVATLVLCSVQDLDRSLAEIDRVLRPGGVLALIEHVVGHGRVGTIHRVAAPAWRVLARGCHLDRATVTALEERFEVGALEPWTLPGTGRLGPAVTGVVRRR
jgi:SAM-dependent methyltransferase